MAKPFRHAKSSVRRYGGELEDYLDIHEFMDSSKETTADNRHRALTHNTWFIQNVIPKVFGPFRFNSDGKQYSPVQIAEEHVLEDYKMKFIPTPQDFLELMDYKSWMDNGRGKELPSSAKKLFNENFEIID